MKQKSAQQNDSHTPGGGGALEGAATIDEALDQTSYFVFNYAVILFTGFVSVNVVLESVGISFAIPVLRCDINITSEQKGILGAVSFIGIIVSSPFWGFLADTIGRKRIMLPTLFFNFFLTVISSFSVNFEMLAVLRFISGICVSAGSATVFVYVGEFHGKISRNRAFLSAAVISATSAVFFPVLAWVSINQSWRLALPWVDFIYKPWRFYFIVCGIPGFLCGIFLCFLPESPKYLLSAGKAKEALDVVKKIHKINTRFMKNPPEFKVTALLPDLDTPSPLAGKVSEKSTIKIIASSLWKQTSPLFMKPHLKHTLLACLIEFILFYTAHGLYMWFPHILNNSMQYSAEFEEPKNLCRMMDFMQENKINVNKTEILEECSETLEIGTYQHTITLEVIYIGLLLLTGYGTGKMDRKPVLFIACTLLGACGIIGMIVKTQLLAMYLFIIMLCNGIGITVLNSIILDIYPTNLRAMAVCIAMMLGRVGSVTGSYIIGLFIEHHCNEALFSFSLTLILAGVLGFLLPKTNGHQKDTKNNDLI